MMKAPNHDREISVNSLRDDGYRIFDTAREKIVLSPLPEQRVIGYVNGTGIHPIDGVTRMILVRYVPKSEQLVVHSKLRGKGIDDVEFESSPYKK